MKRKLQPLTAFIVAGAFAGSLFATTAASAAELTPTTDGYRVRFSPDELNNSSDAEILYRKLKFAAREVCHSGATLRSLTERVQSERCYQQVLAGVVQKINRPMLSSLHASKTSKVG